MAKDKISKDQANYRPSKTAERDCENCSMYVPPKKVKLPLFYGSCTLVKGAIFEDDVCDYWEGKE